MASNSQYVLGSVPSFFVTKENMWKHAVFTALSESAPEAWYLNMLSAPCTMYVMQ
jgi:hypothetical protein